MFRLRWQKIRKFLIRATFSLLFSRIESNLLQIRLLQKPLPFVTKSNRLSQKLAKADADAYLCRQKNRANQKFKYLTQ